MLSPHLRALNPFSRPKFCTTLLLKSTLIALLIGNSTVFAASFDAKKRGEEIFRTTCSVCHGEQGGGARWGKLNPPPRDFTSAESFAKMSRERMINSVTHGRAGSAMQPFAGKLSPQEIEAVVDYIRANFIAKGKPSDMSLPLPNGLVGDKVKGGVIYHTNCTPCHGPRGNGQGPRAYFINPKPRNFTLDTSRRWLNRPILFRIISDGRPGTDMPSWGKVMTQQEVADVAEYVFTQYVQPGKQASQPAKQ